MALPQRLADIGHNHVSEREVAHLWPDGRQDDSRWEDCLWCSVVMFLNDTHDGGLPDTLKYAERLRAASGEPPTGGSNAWDAQRGIKAVLGLSVPVVTGFAALWAALTPGRAAAIAGSMGVFPDGHNLRRHLPGFEGGHSVYVARLDSSDRVWWDDPLAADNGYSGQWVTKADLKRFVDGLPGGGHLVRTLRSIAAPTTEDPMEALTRYVPGYKAAVKATANVRSGPKFAATRLRAVGSAGETWTVIGTVKGDAEDGVDQWVVRWGNGRFEYTHMTNVPKGLVAPATTPTYPDVRPALAAMTTERDAMQARLAIVEPVYAAVEALRGIKQTLGL